MEQLHGIQEAVIKDFFKGIIDMDMGKCFGLTETYIGDGGKIIIVKYSANQDRKKRKNKSVGDKQ